MDYRNGIIYLERGDSFSTPIYINIGTKLDPKYYTLNKTDRLYFGLMEPNQPFEDAVLKKVLSYADDTDDKGNTLLQLDPQDTLGLLCGKYYYSVKLRQIDECGKETVTTVIQPTQFWIQGVNAEVDDNCYSDEYNVEEVIFEGGELTL